MTLRTRAAFVGLLLVLLASVWACGGDDEAAAPPAPAEPAPSTEPASVEPADGAGEQPAGDGKLVFVSAGGSGARAFNAAFLEPFEDETGIAIDVVEQGDDPIAQMKAQVESGNILWDVVGCGKITSSAFPELWEPIDRSIVNPQSTLLGDDLIGDVYVASDVEAFPMIAYSTEAFPDGGPQTWADYFDTEKFAGPRGVPNVGLDSAWSVPAAALLADGVTPEALIPFDLDRAYAKLDELKPSIRGYYTTFQQSQDILRSGEVVMNMMTDGRALQLVYAGEPVGVSFDGAFKYTSAFCIAKGSPNKDNGMRLLNYMIDSPEKQAVFTSLTFYGPTTEEGINAARDLGIEDFSSLHTADLIPDSAELLQYVQENQDELLNRWNAWVSE